jgi:hypothetical protein
MRGQNLLYGKRDKGGSSQLIGSRGIIARGSSEQMRKLLEGYQQQDYQRGDRAITLIDNEYFIDIFTDQIIPENPEYNFKILTPKYRELTRKGAALVEGRVLSSEKGPYGEVELSLFCLDSDLPHITYAHWVRSIK